jgi:uracil-DNA glycosylase
MPSSLAQLERQIIACDRCPRLREHCLEIAATRRRAYADWDYWGKPVPGFGDPYARLFVLGLAPGAHGANRTGRVFTGDRSGDWLYRALHQTGFANRASSSHRRDGLRLSGCWISAAVRCAPPANKPLPSEIAECRRFVEDELKLLSNVKVVVALGRIAFHTYLTLLRDAGGIRSAAGFEFAHNRLHQPAPGTPALISSYHPSQQNTSTGRLTEPMLRAVFERAATLLG